MAYGCRPTCDNCRPKYIRCPSCGARNFLTLKCCKRCKREFTQEDRDEAVRAWEREAETRTVSACYMPQAPDEGAGRHA